MKRCKNCTVALFGACDPDYCRQERQGLIENARWIAEGRGHTLSTFVKIEHLPIWEARCTSCGQTASVCLDPGPGEPDVYGQALETDCATPSL